MRRWVSIFVANFFWVTMPFQTQKRTILSVDDDEVNQIVITSFLEGAGFHVVQAMNGEECLEYLRKAFDGSMEKKVDVPDLVFLDVMMPGMDGYTVCREIRKQFPATLPVIMISAKMTKDDVIHGLTSGLANDYLTKPFDTAMMLSKIEARISLKDSMQLVAAQTKEEYCSRVLEPILPIESSVSVGLISLDQQQDVPGILNVIRKRIGEGSVRILDIQFGMCLVSSTSCDELLHFCFLLKQKSLCFMLSPDRDLFRIMDLHHGAPENHIRLTERFFSRLSESTKTNIGVANFSIVSEYGGAREISRTQLLADIEFLKQFLGTTEESHRRLLADKRRYSLMKDIVQLESSKSDLKSALCFEASNMDALEYRLSKAHIFRKDLASKLDLIDDLPQS